MAKEIKCDRCECHLGWLESGSKIIRGTVYLCRSCDTKLRTKETDANIDYLKNIFGMK